MFAGLTRSERNRTLVMVALFAASVTFFAGYEQQGASFNLFAQRCEPIQLTHTDIEYRIVPDARRPATMEVWRFAQWRELRVLLLPGLALQRLTTREPALDETRVALRAVASVLEREFA